MSKSIEIYLNPFQGRSDGLAFPGQKFDDVDDKTIVEGYEKEIVKKTGEGDEDFIIDKKLVVYRSYSRDKYIQDQSDDVGILNVLKKVALSGTDLTQDNPYAAKPGYVDMTKFPETVAEAEALICDANKKWAAIPDEVKDGMSYDDFIKSGAAQKLYDYYKAEVDKKVEQPAPEEE